MKIFAKRRYFHPNEDICKKKIFSPKYQSLVPYHIIVEKGGEVEPIKERRDSPTKLTFPLRKKEKRESSCEIVLEATVP